MHDTSLARPGGEGSTLEATSLLRNQADTASGTMNMRAMSSRHPHPHGDAPEIAPGAILHALPWSLYKRRTAREISGSRRDKRREPGLNCGVVLLY